MRNNRVDWRRFAPMIGLILFAVMVMVLSRANNAHPAEQPQCQEWKIQVYFDAADRKDGAAMWSTISPHAQSPWKNEGELQAFLDNTPEQNYEAVEIHALSNSPCNYHVLTMVVTVTERTRTIQAVLFHVEMDEYGILGVYIERTYEPIVEERIQT